MVLSVPSISCISLICISRLSLIPFLLFSSILGRPLIQSVLLILPYPWLKGPFSSIVFLIVLDFVLRVSLINLARSCESPPVYLAQHMQTTFCYLRRMLAACWSYLTSCPISYYSRTSPLIVISLSFFFLI